MNYLIDYQCPQCGAPAVLDETDRLFACEFCKVNSFLLPGDYFRYVLPHAKGLDPQELTYIPYWRFKGMQFTCTHAAVDPRFVDTSCLALPDDARFAFSLGLRSQALHLQPAAPDGPGRFVSPGLPAGRIPELLQQRQTLTRKNPIVHNAYIGETISLLYAPFYTKNRLMDAVLNEPAAVQSPNVEMDELPAGKAGGNISFLPTLCPHCGWDMVGPSNSCMLLCKQCQCAFRPSGNRFDRVTVAHLPLEGPETVYLPFYRLHVQVTGLQMESVADFIRSANLPMVPTDTHRRRAMRFWVPAFKIRPKLFLRLATDMTRVQPDRPLAKTLPPQALPTTLPLREALETLRPLLLDLVRPRRQLAERFNQIGLRARAFALVFIPFTPHAMDWVQPHWNIAINRRALDLADSL